VQRSHAVGAPSTCSTCDAAIAPLETVTFELRRAHEGPREALMLVDVTVLAAGGATAGYDAAVHYTFDEHGAIVSLRAFWDLPAVIAALAHGTSGAGTRP
jgi:hypothetical protein